MKLGDAWPVVGRENGRAATSETAKVKLRVDTPCADAHITGVRLSFHPWTDSGFPSLGDHGLIANYGLLDAFAREYASDPHPTNTGERRGGKPQLQDFFLIWLPNRLFNIVAGLGKPPEPYQLDVSTPEGMGTAQWLMRHLSRRGGRCAVARTA